MGEVGAFQPLHDSLQEFGLVLEKLFDGLVGFGDVAVAAARGEVVHSVRADGAWPDVVKFQLDVATAAIDAAALVAL